MNRIMTLTLTLIFIGGCTKTKPVHVTVHGDQPISFRVEVADNIIEQTKGLMFRDHLGQNEGMLFVYEDMEYRYFWMKNTRIPLDIIFIDQDKKIVNIEAAEPCRSKPCKRYRSNREARYVLEINQGLSKRYGFRSGSRVVFNFN